MTDSGEESTIRHLTLDSEFGGPDMPDSAITHHRVRLRLGAELANLPVVRSVSGSVAALHGLDQDTVADLTLAVDEVCSTVIGLAVPGTALECRFGGDGPLVCFEAVVHTLDGTLPDTTSFGWRVLSTLSDRLDCWSRDGIDGSRVHLAVAVARREDLA